MYLPNLLGTCLENQEVRCICTLSDVHDPRKEFSADIVTRGIFQPVKWFPPSL